MPQLAQPETCPSYPLQERRANSSQARLKGKKKRGVSVQAIFLLIPKNPVSKASLALLVRGRTTSSPFHSCRNQGSNTNRNTSVSTVDEKGINVHKAKAKVNSIFSPHLLTRTKAAASQGKSAASHHLSLPSFGSSHHIAGDRLCRRIKPFLHREQE